ncbi:MAG: hypothetical protein Q9183_001633 [Haloplaca sp. 2 TL-2023]
MAEILRLRKENQRLQHQNFALVERNEELAEKLQGLSNVKNTYGIAGLKQEDLQPSSSNLGNNVPTLDQQFKSSTSAMPLNPPTAAYPTNWALAQSPVNWSDLSNERNLGFNKLPTSYRKSSFQVLPAPTVLVQSRSIPILVGGVLFGAFVWESYSLYQAFTAPEVAPQDFDFSHRFNATARAFDDDVEFTEWFGGITKLRKGLAQRAHGNVLEAAVGTGRNSKFYDMKSGRIKSLTALDQSKEMIDVARAKWEESHPKDEQCRFLTSSALESLPSVSDVNDKPESGGYDTIISTMSLCSIPGPSIFLRNLASHLSHEEMGVSRASQPVQESNKNPPSRILLLEHGRSYYAWVNRFLDRSASLHARQHGCWWNRDIGKIASDSGLEIVNMERKHLGTTWVLELGLPKEAQGESRQHWLESNRAKMVQEQRQVEAIQHQQKEQMKEQEETQSREAALAEWRKEEREKLRRTGS